MGDVIAIDGLVASWKGATSHGVAEILWWMCLDTGAMFRWVSYFFLSQNISFDNVNWLIDSLSDITFSHEYNAVSDSHDLLLNGDNIESEIRDVAVASAIPYFVHIQPIRSFLAEQWRNIAARHEWIIVDWRDMWTVVFPDAICKVFMICDVYLRASRRFDQLTVQWKSASMDSIMDDIRSRDSADYRAVDSVNKKASDAYVLDSSTMTLEEQIDTILHRYDLSVTRKEKTI